MPTRYYQKSKEKLQKETRERYQNLSKEKKSKKHQYARERYQNFSEEEINKNENIVASDIRISQKMKNKS